MSAPFVSQLRAGHRTIAIAEPGAGAIAIRVEASDLWETVRVTVGSNSAVAEVKKRVVSALFPNEAVEDDFVLKLHGWDVLDARVTLAEAGVVDGSILLLAYRRRRAVR